MIETIAFTPPWLATDAAGDDVKNPPVFHLRAGSILERDQFEAEMEGRHRAGLVLGFQLLEAAVAGVAALVPGDEGAGLIELLRSEFADGSDLSAVERAQIKEMGDILATGWPEYGALVEREARRMAILPTLAFATWCTGWENVTDADGAPVEYARDVRGNFADALLRCVPFNMIRVAGMEAYAMQYGRSQTKN